MSNIPKIIPDASLGKVDRGQQTPTQPARESSREEAAPEAEKRDLLQVDRERQEEARFTEDAKLLLEEFPEVRRDRVEEVRRRLESGYYERPDVLEQTADKLLNDETALKPLIPRNLVDIHRTDDLTEAERMQIARRRLLDGYYDQSEVLNETARKIQKSDL